MAFNPSEITAVADVRSSGIDTIVPFGKFKGQPVSAMLADQQYIDWLNSQPWFKERYGNIYNVVFNVVSTTADSPEHNEMQAMFLNDNVRTSLVLAAKYGSILNLAGRDADRADAIVDEMTEGSTECTFEADGWDVIVGVAGDALLLEIKPEIGDDLTAVLREVRTRTQRKLTQFYTNERYPVLLYRRYNGSTVTEEQFRKMFSASGVIPLSERDLPDEKSSSEMIDKIKDAIRENVYSLVRPGDRIEHYAWDQIGGWRWRKFVVESIAGTVLDIKDDAGNCEKLTYYTFKYSNDWRKVQQP